MDHLQIDAREGLTVYSRRSISPYSKRLALDTLYALTGKYQPTRSPGLVGVVYRQRKDSINRPRVAHIGIMADGTPYLGATDAILDSIADGVFTVDEQWRIRSFNRAAEEITGVLREEAIGRRCSEVFRCSMCETECALQQTLKSDKPGRITMIPAWGEEMAHNTSIALGGKFSGTPLPPSY